MVLALQGGLLHKLASLPFWQLWYLIQVQITLQIGSKNKRYNKYCCELQGSKHKLLYVQTVMIMSEITQVDVEGELEGDLYLLHLPLQLSKAVLSHTHHFTLFWFLKQWIGYGRWNWRSSSLECGNIGFLVSSSVTNRNFDDSIYAQDRKRTSGQRKNCHTLLREIVDQVGVHHWVLVCTTDPMFWTPVVSQVIWKNCSVLPYLSSDHVATFWTSTTSNYALGKHVAMRVTENFWNTFSKVHFPHCWQYRLQLHCTNHP